jgi:hypothetical protein
MSRPRKPKEKLSRIFENRGYDTSLMSLEIQEEILSQYEIIKKSISTLDPIRDVDTYKTLLNLLLRIESQVKTFSVKTEKMRLKEITKELNEE